MKPPISVVEYVDQRGRSPYGDWFESLHAAGAARVAFAVYQLAAGNFSQVSGVGGGLLERRIDSGPGYRIYFARAGDSVVILFGGSTKQRQSTAIACARREWNDYRRRKAWR